LKAASSPLAGRFNVTPPSPSLPLPSPLPPFIHFNYHQPAPLSFLLANHSFLLHIIEHTPFVLSCAVWIVLTLQLEEFSNYKKKRPAQPRSKDVVQQPQVLDESQYGISQDLD
jgi:hypothetical protein